MAPAYRNSSRRQNRTGVDHDVFEGLPVRQWRRDYVTVVPPPMQESNTSQNDVWAVELPHGMPKDSHMLPQHSQDLLRAARSGRIYKRPPPVEEEEADPEAILGDKPEKKDEEPKDKSFTTKTWKQTPRHLEAPEFEYLAKRRKGLITLSKSTAAPIMVKNKVRREDAAGNEYVEDVIAPKGAQVQGEILAQTVVADPTVADGFAHPTPPKRKPVPPKKKKAKLGRGKKKIAGPTSVPAQIDGIAQSVDGAQDSVGPEGVKLKLSANENDVLPSTNDDTEMGEGSMAASDDEGGDDGEDGDEGDEDEGSVSAQDSPSKLPRPFSPVVSELAHMREIPGLESPEAEMSGTDELPGPPLPKLETTEENSGSPLKNVTTTTPELTSPVKLHAPADTIPPQSSLPETSIIEEARDPTTLDVVMQQEVVETAPPKLPSPPPEPTIAEVISSTEVLHEEMEEEEMLLDIVENNNNASIGALEEQIVQASVVPAETIVQKQSADVVAREPQLVETVAPLIEKTVEAVLEPPIQETTKEPAEDDEPFTDLLGELERQVEEPQADPSPIAEAKDEPEPEKPTEPADAVS